jgi:hypothetical protein
MPVTAKLSQKFYEKLGDDVANELVNWFNAVDATYRTDLRDLNELNFARFDAKLEERIAQLDAKWVERWTKLDAKLEQRIAEVRTEIARAQSTTVKWMFAFWAPTAVGIVATAAGVVALLLRR